MTLSRPEADYVVHSDLRMQRVDDRFVWGRMYGYLVRPETFSMPAEYDWEFRAERIAFRDGSCQYLVTR